MTNYTPHFGLTESLNASTHSLQAVGFLDYVDHIDVALVVSTFTIFTEAAWTRDKIDTAVKILNESAF